MLAAAISLSVACKGKKSDADLQAAATSKVSTIPGVMVEVKEGVATLTGSVSSSSEKSAAEDSTKSVDGIKSVTNNVSIAEVAPQPSPAAPQVNISADDTLTQGVIDILKDFPGATATVKDGVITVNGELAAAKWQKLKMSLDALKPKKVDAAALKVK